MRVIIVLVCCALAMVSAEGDSVERFEARLASAMDKLNGEDTIGIYGDMLSLEKVAVEEADAANEATETDPLVRRIDDFLKSRRLRLRLPNDGSSADYFGRALGEKDVGVELRGLVHGSSEARTKLKRIVLPILLALKLKAAIVLPIVITLIGLLGIKGLGAGLLALLLSGAVALKALLTPPPSYPARVSYARPYEIHHDHWHRASQAVAEEQAALPIVPVNQPYRGWAPEFGVDPQAFNPYQELP